MLIVDNIATNRAALKVKLSAAWYDVSTAATAHEAIERAADIMPNLIIVSNQLPDMNMAEFSAHLKSRFDRATPPLIVLTDPMTEHEPLLRSGVEVVLSQPVDDNLLIARIRSVLRMTAAEMEWRLREGTSRALGFAEPKQMFDCPIPVMCLKTGDRVLDHTLTELNENAGVNMNVMDMQAAMCERNKLTACSVILLDLDGPAPQRALTLVPELRSNFATRHKSILVMVPTNRRDLAAQALDLGADDVVTRNATASELSIRVQRLHKRREINESLRSVIRNGAESALLDPLTGLYNRRYAMPHLDRVAEQSRISGRPFAVMVADLDHFKQVNDWHGHDAGDQVLTECAQRLKQNMRAVDLVARIGGEEFLIVMPATERAAARQAALRLCRKIAETPITLPGTDKKIDVTISIGLVLSNGVSADVASGMLPPESPDTLISRADRALYRAKEMGRNRFIIERSAA
ncbi:diguanylate cyclase [Aliishimia ponticola]|uniref:diguanylate cyclase n=1 Tax=Aliishimia ponticola TaxID=2499833 RepID=UPI001455F060|nr:diguanylate cyclase [Aliishimia ponticola]